MDVSDFDFDLPDELIAQEPPPIRGTSRLLVLHRASGVVDHTLFSKLADHLRAGDLLVLNNTKVFPARLLGRRVPSGGAVECLLLRPLVAPDSAGGPEGPPLHPVALHPVAGADLRVGPLHPVVGADLQVGPWDWEALMHPGQKLKPGARILFDGDGIQLHGEICERHFHGRRTVRLWTDGTTSVMDAIERIGHVPLPPYIRRADRPADRDRYQTVYAVERGSVAAPTAGLHFTPELLEELAALGIERTEVTLHVGYGTFKPMRTGRVEDHVVDPETFVVGSGAAGALTRARQDGRRVIAVGTTTVRVLESLQTEPGGGIRESSGEASLFIRPGHQFQIVGGLITNFHVPRSSLLVLAAAFAGRERMLAAYRDAIAHRYRFYSYGDAMLIL